MTSTVWLLGEVGIRPAERRVLHGGVSGPLGGRAFDLLVALIDHRGRMSSKAELLKRVWPGLVVEDDNLTVHMSPLREAIGAEAITTVVGRSYQLTGELVAKAGARSDRASDAADAGVGSAIDTGPGSTTATVLTRTTGSTATAGSTASTASMAPPLSAGSARCC